MSTPITAAPIPEALSLPDTPTKTEGRLKIFLGAAPGVGKTFAMLRTAQLRKKDGIDVVVGVVETHGRAETEALIAGLDIIPKKRLDYRGLPFDEMDLDAILQRRPALVLVDELAHTNVPGTRHPKRWQDVQELLAAGIDVYTTLNIQHVESLNDVVARIAGVVVRETVPDSLIKRADAIELIDLAPEELLQRLREGKVYIPEQAKRAMSGFFTPGNLTALREMALRAAAERVDDQMLSYMRTNAIAGPWPTRERIMVCVDETPQAVRLIRAAKRAAERRHAPWVAVYVETHRHAEMSETGKNQIAHSLRLAEQLGGETATLTGENAASEILEAARARNVSMIVVGKSARTSISRLFSKSVADQLLEQGTSFDFLVVGGEVEESDEHHAPHATEGEPAPRPLSLPHFSTQNWRKLRGALVATFLGLGIVGILGQFVHAEKISSIYLIAVMMVAGLFGFWPALVTAVLSVMAHSFLFMSPTYSFALHNVEDAALLLIMMICALVAARIATRVQQQIEVTKQNARRTQALYDFSRTASAAVELDDALWAVVHHVASILHCRTLLLLPKQNRLEIAAGYPPEDKIDTGAMAAATWSFKNNKPAGRGSDTLPTALWLFVPLRTARGTIGVLGVQEQGRERALSPEQMRLLETLAGQSAVAIERTQLAADVEKARMTNEAEKLRSALLGMVSRDLQSPLMSLMTSVTSLRLNWKMLDEHKRTHLLETIEDEADQLNRFVQNLLDVTRLGSGTIKPNREWFDFQEVLESAITRLRRQTEGRPLHISMPETRPKLHADYVLLEQVLVNIIDNACKYTPAKSAINILLGYHATGVRFEVCDEGPGIPQSERERVFDIFYRATAESDKPGVGLGLAVCRGLMEAHGGAIRAEAGHHGKGTCIVGELPYDAAMTPQPKAVSGS